MENSSQKKEIKKLTPGEIEVEMNKIFKQLSDLSGCFEPEGKKIMLGKIKDLEKEYDIPKNESDIESEMKHALHSLAISFKEKSIALKNYLVEKGGDLKENLSERIKAYKKNRYFKNKEKNQRNREKYES